MLSGNSWYYMPMDLVSRISENFSESAHLKLQSMDALAKPIAAAAELMVRCL